MSFYSNLASTALNLITKFGQAINIDRDTTSSFNPATGITTPGAVVSDPGYGVALEYKNLEINDTTIQQGDIKLIFNAVAREPEIGDKTTIDSVEYRLTAVKKVSPGGTVVIYIANLRV